MRSGTRNTTVTLIAAMIAAIALRAPDARADPAPEVSPVRREHFLLAGGLL